MKLPRSLPDQEGGGWDPSARRRLLRTVFFAWAGAVLATFVVRSELVHRVEVTTLYLLELFR